MRRRKHAKISPLLYATSFLKPGTVLQTHVCQLNQSPWDVITNFSPPSTPPPPPSQPQVDGDYDFAENGSSGHCISAVESELNNLAHQWEYSDEFAGDIPADEAPPPQPLENDQIIMCCKTDGKSWQCRNEAAQGNSLCEHHLSLVKNYNSLGHHANKKSEKTSSVRRPRPKKVSTSSSTNPYEFYYYSGFGPRWGKKRGETCRNTSSSMPESIGNEHEVDPMPSMSEEFDYDETEDEEEDEEENRENGKKRVRKPIKARSLKSLM